MPFFIDVFHGFYQTAIVPTFIDIVPFLISIVPTNNLFLSYLIKLVSWFSRKFQIFNVFGRKYTYFRFTFDMNVTIARTRLINDMKEILRSLIYIFNDTSFLTYSLVNKIRLNWLNCISAYLSSLFHYHRAFSIYPGNGLVMEW